MAIYVIVVLISTLFMENKVSDIPIPSLILSIFMVIFGTILWLAEDIEALRGVIAGSALTLVLCIGILAKGYLKGPIIKDVEIASHYVFSKIDRSLVVLLDDGTLYKVTDVIADSIVSGSVYKRIFADFTGTLDRSLTTHVWVGVHDTTETEIRIEGYRLSEK